MAACFQVAVDPEGRHDGPGPARIRASAPRPHRGRPASRLAPALLGALIALAVLALSACGDDDPPPGDPPATSATAAPESTVPSLTGSTPTGSPPTTTSDVTTTDADLLLLALEEHIAAGPRVASAPGVTVTVDIPGHGRMSAAAGEVSRVRGSPIRNEPMLPDDHLRIGSLTKTFVAAHILLLVSEGRLGLDDDASTLLPELGLWEGTTIRRLLQHTSGLFNFTDDTSFLARTGQPIAPEDLVREDVARGPVHEPGTAFLYSNTAFIVLGLLIEDLEGTTLAPALRERLLDPHGLDAFALELEEPAPGRMADGHLAGGAAADFSTTWSWAAGGMTGTTDALCDWLRLLLVDQTVLPPDAHDDMITRATLPSGSLSPTGLGLYHATRGQRPVLGHTGSTMGFRGEAFIDPADGTCVAILTNDFLADQTRLASRIWDTLDEHAATEHAR